MAGSAYLFGRTRTLVLMTGLSLILFLASITHLMVLTSAPNIVADLGGLDRFTWLFTAYFLTSTVCLTITGKLSDIYGRRPVFAAALGFFVGGCVICSVAPSMDVLILGRVVQGIGSGGLVPVVFAATADMVAPRARGKWMAFQHTFVLAATMLGPLIGGFLTDTVGWRWLFVLTIPIGAVIFPVIWFGFNVPRVRKKRKLDLVGSGLLIVALGPALLACSWGGKDWGWAAPGTLALFGLGAVGLGVFIWWERRVAEPIVPLGLYRNRTFAAAQVALFALGMSQWAVQTFIPLLTQGALGQTPSEAGVMLMPLMGAVIVTGIIGGLFVSRTGSYRSLLWLNPLFVIAGVILLARLDAQLTANQVIVGLVVAGIGFGLGTPIYNVIVQNAVPSRMMGAVSSANQFSRVVGGMIALSVFGSLMATRLQDELAARGTASVLSPEELLRGSDVPPEVKAHLHDAFAAAVPSIFALAVPVAVLALVASLFVERRELRETLGDGEPGAKTPPERDQPGEPQPA